MLWYFLRDTHVIFVHVRQFSFPNFLYCYMFFLEMGCPRPLHQLMHTAVLLRKEQQP
jgi:hypothetical protein